MHNWHPQEGHLDKIVHMFKKVQFYKLTHSLHWMNAVVAMFCNKWTVCRQLCWQIVNKLQILLLYISLQCASWFVAGYTLKRYDVARPHLHRLARQHPWPVLKWPGKNHQRQVKSNPEEESKKASQMMCKFLLHAEWLSEWSFTSRLTYTGSFRRWVFTGNHLHWYWQLKTNKKKYIKDTKRNPQNKQTGPR